MAVSIDRCTSPPSARRSPGEKLVASLIALMETGTAPWRRPWDGDSGGHHVNLLSGRRYRGSNPALLSFGLHLRSSTLPYWCGFAEAQTRGLVPRRGSQAVYILRPQPIQGRAAQPHGPATTANHAFDGARVEIAVSAAAAEEHRSDGAAPGPLRILYRPIPVFNAADLEGEMLTTLIQTRRSSAAREERPQPERLQNAEAVLQRWPVPVITGGDRACYVPDTDRIHLPARAAFDNAAAHLATWAHEAIHSTGHPSRLGRDLTGVMGAEDEQGQAYAREELVAELGAVLLGERLEIGSDTHNHAAYLSHWITLLRESPPLLLKVLSEARKAADLISPEAPAAEGVGTRSAGTPDPDRCAG